MRIASLDVPYVKQFNNFSCGAASLEMVYGYYGLKNVDQESIYGECEKFDLAGGNFVLKEEVLREDAKKRGFFAMVIQFTFDGPKDAVDTLKDFIDHGVPLIACQQWAIKSGTSHYRVVTGIDKKFVYFHDPYVHNAGKSIAWRHEKFLAHWSSDGGMVLGNTSTVIFKKGAKLPKVAEDAFTRAISEGLIEAS